MISLASNSQYRSIWAYYESPGDTKFTLGFGSSYEVLTVFENGFIVVNSVSSGGDIELNKKNITYHYLAFG